MTGSRLSVASCCPDKRAIHTDENEAADETLVERARQSHPHASAQTWIQLISNGGPQILCETL